MVHSLTAGLGRPLPLPAIGGRKRPEAAVEYLLTNDPLLIPSERPETSNKGIVFDGRRTKTGGTSA